jgi:hypothetical protein
MKTETHLFKNQKTMVWLRDQPLNWLYPERFVRWETIVVGHQAAEAWSNALQTYPSAIVLLSVDAATHTWIQTKAPKQRHLLFMTKAVMDSYGLDTFAKQKFANVICLEEMAEMYPHIQHTFQANDSEATTILSIAALFRVAKLIGFTDQELSETEGYRTQLESMFKLQTLPMQEPEELWLLQQYYESTQLKRAKELRTCLEENLKNPFIDRIILLNEKEYIDSLPQNDKLKEVVIGHRLTYADVVEYIQQHVPNDRLVCFANSDIVLDGSWRQLWALQMKNVFLSLLRYEAPTTADEEPALFGPRPDSQDTWVVHSNSIKDRNWDLTPLQFEFGTAGCDNAINVEFLRKKFLIANPALSLKTLHIHGSGIRTYNAANVVEKPVFLYLEPTGLHDLEPMQNLNQYEVPWKACESFSRRVNSAYEQHKKTFCSMLRRQEVFLFSTDSENVYTPQTKEQVYTFQHGFTTPNGLVYGYHSIYIGVKQHVKEAWVDTKISHMTPCIGVKSVLAVQLPNEVSNNVWKYLQTYLSQVLRLKANGYEGDFWMPREPQRIQDFLQYFQWKEATMPVLPREDQIVAYGTTITMLVGREDSLCSKEEVEALRSMLRPYVGTATNPRKVVIIQDDAFLTTDDCIALEDSLEQQGYEVSVVYPARSSPSYMLGRLLGAAICIAGPGQEALFWLLPSGARVIELMSELQIVGEGAHAAGACSLEYWVILLARAKLDVRRNHILERVKKTLEARPIVEVVEQKPLILLPKGFEGLHGHANDSFREMVSAWFARGWIELEYTTQSPYVWLGGIGQTLLYDRANFNWLNHTPTIYKRILCGNPDAAEVPEGVQWSFWPRHPMRVEQRVQQGLPSYNERTDTLVFYGKVENAVQQSHRSSNLYKACDEFSMPFGADATYTFDQETYLDKLANAKFGLCMAGFGPKCNREIECMALGTIPVVAPDVDMKNYAVPPQEGVHYLRLKSYDPEDAVALVRSMSEEAWGKISLAAHQWWKANASVEGLWDLTQRLASFDSLQ